MVVVSLSILIGTNRARDTEWHNPEVRTTYSLHRVNRGTVRFVVQIQKLGEIKVGKVEVTLLIWAKS